MSRPGSITYFNENAFLTAMGRRRLPSPRKRPPQGWSKEAPDPMRMLKGHPHLRIRKGFALRAYPSSRSIIMLRCASWIQPCFFLARHARHKSSEGSSFAVPAVSRNLS